MSAEWKPGTLAMVGWPGVDEQPMTWATRCFAGSHPKVHHWHNADRNTYLPANAAGITVRPLVVIDDANEQQVARMENILEARGCRIGTALEYALREYANPRDPKPEELLGLGAVVKDDEGDTLVRVGLADGGDNWVVMGRRPSIAYSWSDLTIVRILSDGYEATP